MDAIEMRHFGVDGVVAMGMLGGSTWAWVELMRLNLF